MATCPYCHQEFTPSKYRWRVQKVCTSPDCRKQRQRVSLQQWRDRNPFYYKIKREDPAWRSSACHRARQWRSKNSDRIRAYRQSHIEQYRTYMRLYMRRYRQTTQDADSTNPPKGTSHASRV